MTVRGTAWELHAPFVIAGLPAMPMAHVIEVHIEEGCVTGRGECEAIDLMEPGQPSPLPEIERARPAIEAGADRAALLELLPAGRARNALDCALYDLEAKRSGVPVWARDRPEGLRAVRTVQTLSLDTPEGMARAATDTGTRDLKLKIGSDVDADVARVAAVRAARPDARLCVDVNMGWSRGDLIGALPAMRNARVHLIEQPFPVGAEAWMDGIDRIVPVAADESCQTASSLPDLAGRFDYVNVKLDKVGGLTAARQLVQDARAAHLGVMVGCNLGTSLAMAPAFCLAQDAAMVDLDGPLLLRRDREGGLRYAAGRIHPAASGFWGDVAA